MARMLAIGVATLDIVSRVATYPPEDAEVRALSSERRSGGNAFNTLQVLGQLEHEVHWGGVLAADTGSDFIRERALAGDLELGSAIVDAAGQTPTSYITLSQSTGSRTIVHYRKLREFNAHDFAAIDLSEFDWIHFEGRNIPELHQMLVRVHEQNIPCSLEVEKPHPGIETLFPLADCLIFSRAFVQGRGCDAVGFLEDLEPASRPDSWRVLPWGAAGAYGKCATLGVVHQPAFPPEQLVDTLGAGDVFNAALLDCRIAGASLSEALEAACRLAGRKCGQPGFTGLITGELEV